jgi:hypothetical protein
MDKWLVYHRYNRLVSQGAAGPLLCPDCREKLVAKIGADDDPVLWCMYCDTHMTPGLQFWQDTRSVVSEHYLE